MFADGTRRAERSGAVERLQAEQKNSKNLEAQGTTRRASQFLYAGAHGVYLCAKVLSYWCNPAAGITSSALELADSIVTIAAHTIGASTTKESSNKKRYIAALAMAASSLIKYAKIDFTIRSLWFDDHTCGMVVSVFSGMTLVREISAASKEQAAQARRNSARA
ncbi:MAG TPA: hypothetical protein VN457_05620 [Chlamydiales bacterium]|nr:hypothetical protein [Chlamydiales bacterium]